MCGIAGLAGFRDDAALRRMTARLEHRGPDDQGFFFSEEASLGHQRLSIIDLEGGHQPMTAVEDKVALSFNGEIYNYRDLWDPLEKSGQIFRTRCDTEVLLKGYLEWGLDIVHRLNGMFAFAVIDRREKPVVHLVRDRFGIKPLYYTQSRGKLAFASEIKALLELPWLDKTLDPLAVDRYLQWRYVPGPGTLFSQIQQLPPATILTFEDAQIQTDTYWFLADVPMQKGVTREEAIDRLGLLLKASVKRRMVADVPVGAYLSGGLDSACIAALMQAHGSGSLDTFTVGFGSDKDELAPAADCSRRLGTKHHELICRGEDFNHMERVVYHLDQPIGDAIVLPMYLLAREARKHVKVVLCGEGADEIFGGYLFHKVINLATRIRRVTPVTLQRLGRVLAKLTPHGFLNLFFQYPAGLGRQGKRKLIHFMELLENGKAEALFRFLITLFDDPIRERLYTREFRERLLKSMMPVEEWLFGADERNQLLSLQYRDWLPDLMLLKQDKLTMAHSLEGRFLFMDHELVSYVTSLPGNFKVKGRYDKLLLRQFAARNLRLPASRRPKKPFFIPVEEMKGFNTHFHHLKFLDLSSIARGHGEFLERRREIALWMLDLFFQAHRLEPDFG